MLKFYKKSFMRFVRLLATHHTKFLWSADSVILFKDGKIVSNGPPEEVLTNREFTANQSQSLGDAAMEIEHEVIHA